MFLIVCVALVRGVIWCAVSDFVFGFEDVFAVGARCQALFLVSKTARKNQEQSLTRSSSSTRLE